MLKPLQSKLARTALSWSTQRLADEAGVGLNTVNRFERGHDVRVSSLDKMAQAIERAGVILIEENGHGAGVRMKKGAS